MEGATKEAEGAEMISNILTCLKSAFSTPTNTVPFMLGLFIGLTVFNADIIYNTAITALSGSTFHITKSFFNLGS